MIVKPLARVRDELLDDHGPPVTIDDIEFIDENHAVVVFALTLEGIGSEQRRGQAVLDD